MVRIKEMYYDTADGIKKYPSSIEIVKGIGIRDDKKSGKKGRNLSFMFSEDLLASYSSEGLCIKRFKANIIIDKRFKVNIGDVIIIDKAEIRIDSIGKRCFDSCVIEPFNRPKCPLKSIFMGEVIEGGIIEIGSKINLK